MNKDYVLFGKKFTAEQMLAVSLVLLGFFVILFVILPQIDSIGLQREQNQAKKAEVNELQNSLNVMQSISSEQVEADLKLASSALPTNKDIISIFSAISELASSSDVQLRGFTIKVGELYTKATGESNQVDNTTSVTGVPSMDVTITVSTVDDKNLVAFTQQLYKNFPIARINTLNSQKNDGMIELSFYYRPYDLKQIEGVNLVSPYNTQYSDLIQQLSSSK